MSTQTFSEPSLFEPLQHFSDKQKIRHELDKDQSLFLQDGPTAGLFVLLSGSLELWRTNHNGHKIVLHRASAGESFAEASLYSEIFHCTATANVKSVVIEINRKAMLEKLQSDIEFSNQMLHMFAVQIQKGRRRVELLAIRSAEDRILAALFDGLLCEDIGSFAQLIGLAPETVYRALSKLTSAEKVVKLARGQYRLANQ